MNAMLIIMLFISTFLVMLFMCSLIIKDRPVKRLKNYLKIQNGKDKTLNIRSYKKSFKEGFNIVSQKAVKLFALSKYIEAMEKKLERADIPLNPEEMMILMAATSAFVAVVSGIITHNIFIAIFAGIVMWFLMKSLLNSMVSRRIRKMNEQLADALDLISASLRTGYSFMKAIEVSSIEMPNPIAKEFGKAVKESALGLPIEKTLDNLMERIPTDDMRLVKTGVVIQRQIGGNLAEILDNISATIRSRMEIKREVKTLTAQGRVSGLIIALIPVFLTVILLILDPKYLSVLFKNRIGIIMIFVAIINEIIGFIIISKIISIEY